MATVLKTPDEISAALFRAANLVPTSGASEIAAFFDRTIAAGAIGDGIGVEFRLGNDGGALSPAGNISAVWDIPLVGAEISDLEFDVQDGNGGGLVQAMLLGRRAGGETRLETPGELHIHPDAAVTPVLTVAATLVTVADALAIGSTVAAAGTLRLADAADIVWRDSSDGDDLTGVVIDNDNAYYGVDSTGFQRCANWTADTSVSMSLRVGGNERMQLKNATIVLDPSTTTTIKVAGTPELTIAGLLVTAATALAIGGAPADTGSLRLVKDDAGAIKFRDAGGAGNVTGLTTDGANNLFVGGTVAGAERPTATTYRASVSHALHIVGAAKLTVASSLVTVADALAVGSTSGTIGDFRLPNVCAINASNGVGGSIALINKSNTNAIQIGEQGGGNRSLSILMATQNSISFNTNNNQRLSISTALELNVSNMQWKNSVATPRIFQVEDAGFGGIGETLLFHAQNEVGGGATVGGAFHLRPGSGVTGGRLALQDGASNDNIAVDDNGAHVLRGVFVPPTVISNADTPYTVLDTDSYIHVDTSTGVVQINLPASAAQDGRVLPICDLTGNGPANNITINANGAETIIGAGTLVMAGAYESVVLHCNAPNTDWMVF